MNFNTEVTGCYWQGEQGKWKVRLRQATSSGGIRQFDDYCDLLLSATGLLNNWKWPDIEGLDSFKGRIIHTASWPNDYQKQQWRADRVAVIGSGASSIQTVPEMQPHVQHMDIFVRTVSVKEITLHSRIRFLIMMQGVWFSSLAQGLPSDYVYSEEEKDEFRRDPAKMLEHAKFIENQISGNWELFFKASPAQNLAQNLIRKRMKEKILDERLFQGISPENGIMSQC
jgi:hydroxyversicolorone monooxygenase